MITANAAPVTITATHSLRNASDATAAKWEQVTATGTQEAAPVDPALLGKSVTAAPNCPGTIIRTVRDATAAK